MDTPEFKRLAESIDLSRDVEAAIERSPGDQVRCTRVGESRYRCNWWARPGPQFERGAMSGMGCTELRVRKSSLLVAIRTADGLSIREAAHGAAR